MKTFLPFLLLLPLGACAVNAAPSAVAPVTQPPAAAADSGIPYPQTDTESQLRRLSLEISRLQYQIGELENRLNRLEPRRSSTPVRSPAPRTVVSAAAPAAAPAANRTPSAAHTAPHTLQQAQVYYRNGDYAAAAQTLSQADSGGNGSETDRQSMYLLLQSQQKLGNCESVINIANRYVSRFRASPEAAEALFAVGQCQWNMQQRDIARDTWRKLTATYPDSPAARRAIRQLNP